MSRDSFDGRFRPSNDTVKSILVEWLGCPMFTVKDMKDMLECAEKLGIPDYKTKSTVEVLFEIAGRLSVLEAERVSPLFIMDEIRNYLNGKVH